MNRLNLALVPVDFDFMLPVCPFDANRCQGG
jgi:hypothetical protein